MVKLPNGEDCGIAIRFGRYNDSNLMEVLRHIEDNYEGIKWWDGDKPTEYTPGLTDSDEYYYEDEIADFVLFIKDNELDWGSAKYIYDEDRDYDYIIYTPYEFMNCSCDEEIEIENEIDISFLYG